MRIYMKIMYSTHSHTKNNSHYSVCHLQLFPECNESKLKTLSISACDLRTSHTSCESSPSPDYDEPCDLRLLTPATCLRELSTNLIQIPITTNTTTTATPAISTALTTTTTINPSQLTDSMIAAAVASSSLEAVIGEHRLSSGILLDTALPAASAVSNAFGQLLASKNKAIPPLTPLSPIVGGAYTCERCGNSYARPHSLNRHKRFECGVEPKFECPICRKKSKHKHNLVLHMRTHQHRWSVCCCADRSWS